MLLKHPPTPSAQHAQRSPRVINSACEKAAIRPYHARKQRILPCQATSVDETKPSQGVAQVDASNNGAPISVPTDAPHAQPDVVAATLVASVSESQASMEIPAEADVGDGIQLQPTKGPLGLFVRVRNMVKHFNTSKGVFKAVNGVDVDIEPSSIVALLGPSGSGKTTLLRLIAGLEQPTDGKLYFDDMDATNLSVQDRQIGFVFQSYALFNHKNVAENIRFGLEMRKLNIDHDKRVADLLDLVQLRGLENRYPRQLSGGQRQRVALARALASNPRLLLLDEPFGALDAVVRKSLRAGLKEIVRSVGVTTIIVTHDQEEAFDLADKVVVFNRGIVEQQGSPTQLIKSPRTPFIMKFVGETNVVPAQCAFVRRMRFSTTKSKVMFRPMDIEVFTEPGSETTVVSAAEVKDRINLGWTIKYVLEFDDGVEIEFGIPLDQDEKMYNLDIGQRVYIRVNPSAMMGFNTEEIESTPLV